MIFSVRLSRSSRLLGCLGLFFFLSGAIRAQQGDRPGHVMAPPPAAWKIPSAPVLSAEEELRTFTLEKGFTLDLIASEPMVQDPVALTFDGRGRMWVAEMLGYMPDVDGTGEDSINGRISVLEDTDGDGKMDRSTHFLDNYVLPRALALIDGDKTLLFADNAKLYEAEILIDKDGRIRSGKVTLVDGEYAPTGNPEHKSNGLMRALDNWIYNAASRFRYRKTNGVWQKEKTETRGQWGIVQDNYGRLLTNTNSNLVTVEELPPNVSIRNPDYTFRTKIQTTVKDQHLWPGRINPGVNRGYMEGVLDENGYLLTPTAASGLAIYRGDLYPAEYQNQIFIPEPSANLLKRLSFTEGADGFHTVESAVQGREFLTSTDERNRIVNVHSAPDGTLYLVDMYRGIIQHKVYVTSYLRAQILDRGLDKGIGYGRIWRVRSTDAKALDGGPHLTDESSSQLVARLSHPNGWWRDTAQRLIVERGGIEAVPALKALLADGKAAPELACIHAIWTLEGLGQLNSETLKSALANSHPRAVAEAVRAAESLAGTDQADAVFDQLLGLRSVENLHVRRQLVSTLGLFDERAVPVLAKLVSENESESLLFDLAMSGLSGHELAFLEALPEAHPDRALVIETLVRRNIKAELDHLIAGLKSPTDFKALARAVVAQRRGDKALDLIQRVSDSEVSEKIRKAIIAGMLSGAKDKQFKPMPIKDLKTLDLVATISAIDEAQQKQLVALFEQGTGKQVSFLRTEADKKQFKEGEAHYQRICLGCHMDHGNGQQYIAPPLAGSEWVLGSPQRMIAILMDGVTGPIEVMGKTYTAPEIQPLMPGLRENPDFTDEQIAAMATYVRNAWGNGAKPIPAEAVTQYRTAQPVRESWTPEELKNIP